MKKGYLFLAILLLLVSLSFAKNPVTVGPGGDFANIQPAIASWCTGGANASETPPFIINVNPAGSPYVERLTLDNLEIGNGNIVGDLIIQTAIPGTYPYVALQQGLTVVTAVTTSGCKIFQADKNVTIDGLLFMPSLTAPTMSGYWFWVDENAASGFDTMTFKNCLFTQIDSGGNPIVTSRAAAYTAGTPAVPPISTARMLHFYPDNGELKHLVVDNCTFYGAQEYSIVAYLSSNDDTVTIRNCCIAWGLSGYQVRLYGTTGVTTGATATITGTDQTEGPDNCTVFIQQWSGDNHSLLLSTGNNFCTLNLEKTIFSVLGPDLGAAGSNTRNISGTSSWITNISDCIVYNEGDGACVVEGANSPQSWNRLTLHSSGIGVIFYLVAGTSSIACRDCIFSGVGTVWDGTLQTGGIDVDYCAYVENGPDAITLRSTTTPFQTDGSNIVTADPMYLNRNFTSAQFMDVTNTEYEAKGTAGSDLAGGADYAPPTRVYYSWSLYE